MDFAAITAWVATFFASDQSGHDMVHILRVEKNALFIAEAEHLDAREKEEVRLIAILHEMLDKKFFPDKDLAHQQLVEQLAVFGFDAEQVASLVTKIGQISFSKRTAANDVARTVKVVQDADLLEAIGAIGVARTMMYGATHNNPLYDPKKAGTPDSSIIQHFYDKLLKIQDLFSTTTGRKLGQRRTDFMKDFLAEFYAEWEGGQ